MKIALGALLGVLLVLGAATPVLAGTCSVFRTWSAGASLTAGDLNSSFTTVGQTNMTLACLSSYSANATQMQTTVDPYPSGSESLATTGQGEIERLRYMWAHVMGFTYWYRKADNINLGHRRLEVHMGATTGLQEMFVGQQTWSNAAVRFHGVAFGVADQASHPESALVRIHVGGTTQFLLSKTGAFHAHSGRFHHAGALTWAHASSGHYVGLRAHAALHTTVQWILPVQDGAAGQVLQTDGAATLTFVSATQLTRVHTYTTAGTHTYTVPGGITKLLVRVWGGGGGGGGSNAAAADAGSGGGGGGYCEKLVSLASGSTVTVTVGAAGAAGTSSGAGGAGGTSSFGAHCSATAGAGGEAGSADTDGGAGGAPGGGGSGGSYAGGATTGGAGAAGQVTILEMPS
jgi:hypothetical protein